MTDTLFLIETTKSRALTRALTSRPPTWTYVAKASSLGERSVLSVVVDGTRLAIFRDAEGRPAALHARCAHLGADLAHGTCEGGRLQCPFHAWAYGADGRCTSAGLPSDEAPRVRAYAIVERLGALFVFVPTGARESADATPEEAPPFPFDDVLDDGRGRWAVGAPVTLPIEAPWFWVAANGFDLRHFEVVHGRRPLEAPRIEREDDDVRTARYAFEIMGRSFADRIVRALLGDRSVLVFSTWRGAVLSTEAHFGRGVSSRVLFFVEAVGAERSVVRIFPLERIGRWPLARAFAHARLLVKRALIWSFFREEVRTLRHLTTAPVEFTAGDAYLARYFDWLERATRPTGTSTHSSGEGRRPLHDASSAEVA